MERKGVVRTLEVDGTYNTRSWGAEPGRWLYRSASIDGLTEAGRTALDQAGIGLVIDLRETSERGGPASGVPTRFLPIYNLSDGPPRSGSLGAVYEFMLLERAPQLGRAVAAIAQSQTPVLVHCTAGKDRTGLVVALALLAADVPDDEVLDDYAASGNEVARERREIVVELLTELQLSGKDYVDALELHLDSPIGALGAAIALVRGRHGSVTRYLLANGVSADDVVVLRERLRAGS